MIRSDAYPSLSYLRYTYAIRRLVLIVLNLLPCTTELAELINSKFPRKIQRKFPWEKKKNLISIYVLIARSIVDLESPNIDAPKTSRARVLTHLLPLLSSSKVFFLSATLRQFFVLFSVGGH